MNATWILLRGLTRGSGHWGDFVGSLQDRLGDVDCIALDLPGNGASNDMRSLDTVEAMATYCRERLDAQRVATPVYVLGVSMGAMIAVEWATRAPRSIAGCVLVNTSFARVDPWFRRLRPSSYATLLSGALGPSSLQQETAILRLTSHNAEASAAVLDAWARLRESHPVSSANALRQLFAASRYRLPPQPPDVPMLVLCSEQDALVDWRCSLALAERWQIDSDVHPSAGHDLTLDDGPWVAQRIQQWLMRDRDRRIGSASSPLDVGQQRSEDAQ